jgi:hypothetical protein
MRAPRLARPRTEATMIKVDAISECTVIDAAPRTSRWTGFVRNVMAGIRDGGEMYARYQALQHMSNADLARRGVTRDRLTQVILHGGGF